MLLSAEAWRLGGTLLGEAVVCEQKIPSLGMSLARSRAPAAAPTTSPLRCLFLSHEAQAVPHLGGLKPPLFQSFSPLGGCGPNFPN